MFYSDTSSCAVSVYVLSVPPTPPGAATCGDTEQSPADPQGPVHQGPGELHRQPAGARHGDAAPHSAPTAHAPPIKDRPCTTDKATPWRPEEMTLTVCVDFLKTVLVALTS